MKIQGPINTKAVIAYCHTDKAYQEALKLVEKLYKTKKRNFTGVGYFSHPTTVASLLLETPTQSTQMVASALMDLLKFERVKPSSIQTKFGDEILAMVQTLTPVLTAAGATDWKVYGDRLQAGGYPIQTIKVASLLDHVCAIPKAKLAEAFEQLDEVDKLLPYLQGANAELLRRLTVALRNARA